MELSFAYSRERQFYALRFSPAAFESTPFVRELRFWGVDRFPCPSLSLLAALIALKSHPASVFTVPSAFIHPPVCTALAAHFGVEIYPSSYEADRRDLPGGDKIIAPMRFGPDAPQVFPFDGTEVLAWISLNDLGGPFGGSIRTNVDVFDLSEPEKNLIVALCCGGLDLGHVILDKAAPGLVRVMHRIGLDLVETKPLP